LSGVYYSTSVKALHQLAAISKIFRQFGNYEFFEPILDRMKTKFLRYWDGVPMLYCLAMCIDPRGKVDFCMRLVEVIGANLEITPKPTKPQVEAALHELFDQYSSRFGTTVGSSSSVAPAARQTYGNEFSMWGDEDAIETTGNIRSELDDFLVTPHHYIRKEYAANKKEFDPLIWWKSQVGRWPVLSLMARDILTTPVSSVACEQVFSISGNVLDDRRSRLKADILEATMCVMDWERARLRSQQNTELWIEDFAGMSVTDD
jgi:hypothetical protein